MLGDFTWTGWDYLGEAGAGMPRYGDEVGFFTAYPVFLAQVGDIDITGFRRPMSYLREIVFGLRKAPFIAAQLPEHYHDTFHGTPWAASDAIESWTFDGFEGKPIRVEVYSDAEEVELFIKGASRGRQPAGEANRFKAVFDTVYERGTVEAAAIRNGIAAERFALKSASDDGARFIAVEAEKTTLTADGQDAAYLNIRVTDRDGIVDTSWQGGLTVKVEGAGTLQGFGSANPTSEENYTTADCEPYYGRALAVVRAGQDAGEISVTVTAEGLAPATCRISVQ